jgi:hypothetical protein
MRLAAEVTQFDVVRTTTDKLEDLLNGYGPGWDIVQITHTGGRDWVVFAVFEHDDVGQKDEALNDD